MRREARDTTSSIVARCGGLGELAVTNPAQELGVLDHDVGTVGVENAKIGPAAAAWDPMLGEFVLRYADVRSAADPRAAVREFLTSTYEALAELAQWPKAAE